MSDTPDARVIAALRTHGGLTRHGLVSATGLSLATVNRVLTRLTKAGRVGVSGAEPSTGGRPPEVFAYNGAGQIVAGVSVSNDGATALLMTLDGTIVGREAVTFQAGDDPEARLRHSLELIDRVVDRPEGRPAGVGVAVPGVVAGQAGTLSSIHELAWNRLALGDLLSRHTDRPIVVDNDANCLAVAEHRHGAGRGLANLVALVARNGLGAGLIIDGRLYRGTHHEAGEVGYLLTQPQSLRRLFPDRGELEQLIGGERLAAEARRLGVDPSQATLPSLIGLGQVGGGARADLAEELLDLTALTIAAMCIVLDPEVVIIGGGADGMAELITGVRQRLLGRILRVPRLEAATLGADAIMIGAASLAAEVLA